MEFYPIKTEADYEAALQEIELLFDAAPNTPECDRLEVLSTLVEAYEEEHFPIGLPDPIEAILYYIEARGLSQQDLEVSLGGQATVSDVLSRKSPLTLEMIQRLTQALGIPAEILVQPYNLTQAHA